MRAFVGFPALALGALAVSSSTINSAKAPPPGPDPRPIFQAKCVSCHSGAQPAAGLDLSGDLATIAGAKQVVRSRPRASALYKVVANGSMPKGGTPLAPEEVATVRDWIMSLRPDPRPLFQAKCGCHSGANPAARLDLSGDLPTLAALNQAVSQDGTGTDATLYKRIADGSMPKNGQKLSDAEMALVQDWIAGTHPNPKGLFTAKCGCHAGGSPAGGLDLSADLGTIAHASQVKSGAPAQSALYLAVANGSMPKGGRPPLSDSEAGLIWDWIAAQPSPSQ